MEILLLSNIVRKSDHLSKGRRVNGSELFSGGFESCQHGLKTPSLSVRSQLLADTSVYLSSKDSDKDEDKKNHLGRIFLHEGSLPSNICQLPGCYKTRFHVLQNQDSMKVRGSMILSHLIDNIEPVVLFPPEVVAEVDRHHEVVLIVRFTEINLILEPAACLKSSHREGHSVCFWGQQISLQPFQTPISGHYSVNYHCHWAHRTEG